MRSGTRVLTRLGSIAERHEVVHSMSTSIHLVSRDHTLKAACLVMCRHLRIFDIFDKEKIADRRRRLKEDMQRGYFDDFKDLRESGGKMFPASEQLMPADVSAHMPTFQATRPDATTVPFPPPEDQPAATLLCIAFRDGAEEMLQSWARPFAEYTGRVAARQPHLRRQARLVDLSLVESWVMGLWPFRGIILRGGAGRTTAAKPSAPAGRSAAADAGASAPEPDSGSAGAAQGVGSDDGQRSSTKDARASDIPRDMLFKFGDATELRSSLGMTNRLTGYVYLLDQRGRVRWRGSGHAQPAELAALLACVDALMPQDAPGA